MYVWHIANLILEISFITFVGGGVVCHFVRLEVEETLVFGGGGACGVARLPGGGEGPLQDLLEVVDRLLRQIVGGAFGGGSSVTTLGSSAIGERVGLARFGPVQVFLLELQGLGTSPWRAGRT